MLTYKSVLAASTAIVLGAGTGFATNVFAQVVSGQPAQSPSNPPVPSSQAPNGPAADTIGSNFRRDGLVTVQQRPREGYEARGIRSGALLIYPKVNVTLERSDNIFASSIDEKSDNIWHVQPEITVNSDWIRHQLTLFARASFNRYQDHSDENTQEWGVGGSGRIDATRATQVNWRLDYARITEPRTSPNSILPPGGEPVQYDMVTFGLLGRHEFNRLLATGRFDMQKFTYDSPTLANGQVLDQSYRDRTISTVEGRLDYALSPATAFFGQVVLNRHDSQGQASGGIQRDSDGFQAHVGINFEITALIRGDIGVGYMRQNVDQPGQEDLDGFSTNALVAWAPTQLTTVTLTATRSVEDSAVPGAAAYLSTNLRARVDHELLRNVILTAQAGYGDDDYTGVVREDRRTSAGVGVTYLINRTVGLSATYNYLDQDTRKGIGTKFKENRVGATLTVQY